MKPRISLALLLGVFLAYLAAPTLATAAAPFAWTVTPAKDPVGYLSGISCPSTSLCVGVGAGYESDIVTTTNPTGGPGAWNLGHLGEYDDLRSVACPSISLCVATGFLNNWSEYGVAVSTNPAGGAGTWTTVRRGMFGQFGIASCPSASLCISTTESGLLASTDQMKTWFLTGAEFISAISCPTELFCVAVAHAGNTWIATSADPTGDAHAWKATQLEFGGVGLDTISCPTEMFCVAVGGVGGEGVSVTSTDPLGGTHAWVLHGGLGPLSRVTCVSPTFCAADGEEGDAVATSTDPTGNAEAWSYPSGFTLEEPDLANYGYFGDISCPSESLCVIVDRYGNIIWGAPAVKPVNTGLPEIANGVFVGSYLKCEPGSWSGKPLQFGYQWLRDGVASGPISQYPLYRVEPSDEGHALSCAVTAFNDAGETEAISAKLFVPVASPRTESVDTGEGGIGASHRGHRSANSGKPTHCIVPNVVGERLGKAVGLLTRRYCGLGQINARKRHRHRDPKRVIHQRPKAGTVLPIGGRVSMVVG
jgi:hypothetical protein